VFTSPFPDVEIPDVSIYDDLFADLSADDAARIALIDPATGAETTYGALKAQVDAFAGALAARGVGTDTVLGLLCPNVPAFATVFHGILRAGATVTTINSLYTAGEIEKQLRDAGASWLITVSPLLAAAQQARRPSASPPSTSSCSTAPTDTPICAPAHRGPRRAGGVVRSGDARRRPALLVGDHRHSQGRHAEPPQPRRERRTVPHQHRPEEHRPRARGAPFFHIYGMTVLLNLALKQRATLVTMPKFDLVQFLTNIQTYGCTYLYIAPPIAVALAKHPIVDQYDISTVHTVFSGAAARRRDGRDRRPPHQRPHDAGLRHERAEPRLHAMPYTRDDIPVSSVGTILPNIVCKLVDTETGEEITEIGDDGRTRPGELWVQGPNVMLGYLNKPDATAETLDADGFLHTGDVAVYHDGGYFSIVDRVKELIKYKGYQIAPAELEALLLGHPKVMDAAVIGVLDDDKQEIPKAFIVPRPTPGSPRRR
jgi:acyl-CoA synthetase (AMP-forming)/AMP-acid ligase II